MPEESKLAAALRECEEACPCMGCEGAADHHPLDYCITPRCLSCRVCGPLHAAIARYGDLREKAGYERGKKAGRKRTRRELDEEHVSRVRQNLSRLEAENADLREKNR